MRHAHRLAVHKTDKVNEVRENLKLPPLKPATKSCLKCGESFKSTGAANRMCYPCRRKK